MSAVPSMLIAVVLSVCLSVSCCGIIATQTPMIMNAVYTKQ